MAEQSVARAEQLYRLEMEAREVPAQLIEGLVRYLVHRIRPGHFLTAALSGDVREALGRADPTCQRGFGALCLFLFSVAPRNAWGSVAAVEAWLADRHLSAQACGCDSGAGWTCEEHRNPDAHLGAVIDSSMHGGDR